MRKKRVENEQLPIHEDLQNFGIDYVPEKFTKEEQSLLRPFFTNLDLPVYALKNLPPEITGALSSRYSRCDGRLRRVFLREYIAPIVDPETQKNWEELTRAEKKEALDMKQSFLEMVDFFNSDRSPEKASNLKRARKFFDTWLSQYGDDSIAELGSLTVCIEGASNVAVNIIEGQRIGLSPLEKSTRYVSFWEKVDGHYMYVIPGELKGTKWEKKYHMVMDLLFDTYTKIAEPYKEYIKEQYPKGDDETDRSFNASRGAKRFDDLRELLPFSTQTSLALNGNGRAYEQLITRLLSHPSGEVRWWGQLLARELDTIIPSFVRRVQTERGAQVQKYRKEVVYKLPKELATSLKSPQRQKKIKRWVNLVSWTQNADVEVISTYLFQGSVLSLEEIRKQVMKWSDRKRTTILARILEERKLGDPEAKREHARFRKPPRAFENATFTYELYARGGDYRDLHRHRMATQNRQLFTTEYGYDMEEDVINSPFLKAIEKAFRVADTLYKELKIKYPYAAEYVVPFGFLQHWYMNLTARGIYWIGELRTGPQGRPHYRVICQQLADQARAVAPGIMQGIMIDYNQYGLARRESEKKIDKRLNKLNT